MHYIDAASVSLARRYGQTAVYIASMYGHVEAVHLLCRWASLSISTGALANLNASLVSVSRLVYASLCLLPPAQMPPSVSSRTDPHINRWAGADVEIRANGGSSCCTAAAATGKSGVLLALSRAGRADLSAAGAEGRTPLQVAVEGGHEEAAGAVRRMLNGGGDLEAAIDAVEGLRLHSADAIPAAVAADDLPVLPNESERRHTGAPFPPLCGEECERCSGSGGAAVDAAVLIDASADHPGAGSFLADGALTPSELARLRALYTTLEGEAEEAAQRRSQAAGAGQEQETEGVGEGSSAMGSETLVAPASITRLGHPRPVFSDAEAAGESARYGGVERRYFCDAEGWVRAILARALERASPLLGAPLTESNAAVHPAAERPTTALPSAGAASAGALPFMRFLHYRAEGASMAPHVDLSKKAPGDQVWGSRRPSDGRGGTAWNPPMLTVKPVQRAGRYNSQIAQARSSSA